MNGRLSELQQESVSTATLNSMVKNKTEEIETLKQRLNSILTGNSEVAVTISGLTDTVLVTKSRLDEQMSTIEGLTAELEGQKMELSSLKESYVRNKKALERHRQEVMDIKWVTLGALRDHRLWDSLQHYWSLAVWCSGYLYRLFLIHLYLFSLLGTSWRWNRQEDPKFLRSSLWQSLGVWRTIKRVLRAFTLTLLPKLKSSRVRYSPNCCIFSKYDHFWHVAS